jgi:hypothetical protein
MVSQCQLCRIDHVAREKARETYDQACSIFFFKQSSKGPHGTYINYFQGNTSNVVLTFYETAPFFWRDRGLNSGLDTCKAGILPLKLHLQSILLWLLWRWGGSHELFPWAGLKPWPSWSQPPKKLQLQVWATSTWLGPQLLMILSPQYYPLEAKPLAQEHLGDTWKL